MKYENFCTKYNGYQLADNLGQHTLKQTIIVIPVIFLVLPHNKPPSESQEVCKKNCKPNSEVCIKIAVIPIYGLDMAINFFP